MHVTLDGTNDEADHIRTFWFKPEQAMHYNAGQYTELTLPHHNPDERGIKHWFTLSSSPTEKRVSITTKLAVDHPSTFKQALWQLPIGTKLHMAEAMGDFVLPKDKTIPLVFVAGGIGVTPFHSMIKYLIDSGEKRDIHLIYAANRLDEVAFRPMLEAYVDKFQMLLGEPPADWRGESGHLSADKILELVGDYKDKRIFLSGPEPMVKQFERDLLAKGLENHQVIVDDFPGYIDI